MDETLAGAGAAPLIAALDSASPDRAAVRASARVSIDWEAVREKLARRTADLEATFAGRGPWADAVLARRAEELAATPQTGDLIDGEAGIGTPMLVARGVETLYGLELRHLGHIVPMPRLARVPGAPPAVLGVIAVAGRVMRLFDLDRLCSGPSLRGPPAAPKPTRPVTPSCCAPVPAVRPPCACARWSGWPTSGRRAPQLRRRPAL
ncbi:chemotaxis protein CheW [Azospirillum sp. NL1]|uniref:chemotaxis protein CheW n=1 Tax=Azospirillum sp. NL1 TaxID=3082952 RepID=UPI0029897D78|nr:chemotaxis protein CheW [Azospirillum sp. NL1]MDW5532611.1 chemotaxis protein CheW [Azospirillum sp. NL1]